MDWQKAIFYVQTQVERIAARAADAPVGTFDETLKFVWKRLQLGQRSQELFQQIETLIALEQESVGKSPEWEAAIKFLAVERAKGSNLILDMIWKQLETGDRTPELLQLIGAQAAARTPTETVQ